MKLQLFGVLTAAAVQLVSFFAVPLQASTWPIHAVRGSNHTLHNVAPDATQNQKISLAGRELGRDSMMEIVNNAMDKNRGMECRPLKEDLICDRIEWFTKKDKREDETWNGILTRLVSYQVFKQSLPEKADDIAFDTLLDTIRGGNEIIAAPGSLVGDNARILDALDVILDDICAETSKSKVDRRLQEMIDIVQSGLRDTEPPPYALLPMPAPCQCYIDSINSTICLREASINWNATAGEWTCHCFRVYCHDLN
ncbi:uncharacterized protein F4822DRAFT_423806 [Hypoxylon trugodes]|uniref:uncharacterized protein n=1 Tax=Hypoxylon trugodes TaxID=326681 RepID=UPI002190D8CC|nr:uncharacterized protein F4822DRAFT_423806 [Hypoxylon trugodes]KAI1393336.1 hypothetical protein F4822DRAFT_423806 [Hypoxylon trugodes]